jgi:hypothetical protein
MESTYRRRGVGIAFILVAAIVALVVVGTLMASCQTMPAPSAQPSNSSAPASGESAPPVSASPAEPSTSPDASTGASPAPRDSFGAPGGPTPVSTFVFVTPPPGPGQPGSSIEIPPPID